MSDILTKDSLLGGNNSRRVKQFTLPDGRLACVRSLTELEWSNYTAATISDSGKLKTSRLADATRRLIVLCLCDEKGSPLLRPSDMDSLASLDSAITQAIYKAAREHIGVEEGDIEDLAKNSDAIHGAA